MRNAKKTLSLVMVAIFTTFIVLSGIPTSAATVSAAAKAQTTKATYYVVKAENVASTYSVAVAKNQYAVAVQEVRALKAFGSSVAVAYASLSARVVNVNKTIAARAAVNTDLVAAEKLVDKAEELTNTDTYDLVGVEADLANAQNAVTDALEGIVKLDKDSSGYKGLMARVDAANAKIIAAMDQIQVNADAAAQVKAAADAEAAVKAVEAAPLTTAAEVAAAVKLGEAAVAAVATVEDAAVVKALNDRLAAVLAKGKAFLADAKVVTVSAVDGTITVTFDKALKAAISLADLKVTRTVTTDVAVTTNVAVTATTNGAVATLVVPAVAAIATPQAVVYTVAYGTTTTSAVAYTVAALPAVGVASASATIPTEITVVFNQEIDETTAETVTNYSLNGTALDSTATAVMQADKKSVVLTAAATAGIFNAATGKLTTNVGYIVSVSGVKSLDTLRTASAAKSPAFVYVADATAPTLVSAAAKALVSTTSVTATFSEPVQGVGYYTVNGVAVGAAFNTVPKTTVTLTLGTAIVPGTVYTLQVINEKDAAGNLNTPNPASVTFTVALSNAAPTVTVKTTGDKQINLTFSASMDTTTLTTANVKLLDGNLAATAAGYTVVQGSDATLWNINLPSSVTFNSANQLALTLVLTTAVKDSLGNAMVATTVPVVLTKDTVKPVILSAQYVKAGKTYGGYTAGSTNGALVLTFSEEVALPAALSTSDLVAITDKGAVETVSSGTPQFYVSGTTTTKTIVIFPLSTVLTSETLETLRINADLFTDVSIAANKNAAQVLTADIANPIANAAAADTTAPVVTVVNTTSNVIQVNLGEAITGLDASTVLNVSNYRLNGGLLPAGTYVTVSGNNALLTLPTGSVAKSGTNTFNVIGIKDAAGNLANPAAGSISLIDNTKPTMTAIAINTDGTITATFSEAVVGAVTGDFIITRTNASATNAPITGFTVSAPAGSDYGKVVIGSLPAFATGDVITITLATSPTVHDVANTTYTTVTNVANGGTALSVTK